MRAAGKPRALALIAALAVAMAGVLPAEHLHASDGHADGPVLHRHVIDTRTHHGPAGGGHAESVDHDDHAEAHFLSVAFVTTSKFATPSARAAHSTHPMHLACPTHALHRLDRPHLLPTHDPPLSFISSPAPPSAS